MKRMVAEKIVGNVWFSTIDADILVQVPNSAIFDNSLLGKVIEHSQPTLGFGGDVYWQSGLPYQVLVNVSHSLRLGKFSFVYPQAKNATLDALGYLCIPSHREEVEPSLGPETETLISVFAEKRASVVECCNMLAVSLIAHPPIVQAMLKWANGLPSSNRIGRFGQVDIKLCRKPVSGECCRAMAANPPPWIRKFLSPQELLAAASKGGDSEMRKLQVVCENHLNRPDFSMILGGQGDSFARTCFSKAMADLGVRVTYVCSSETFHFPFPPEFDDGACENSQFLHLSCIYEV